MTDEHTRTRAPSAGLTVTDKLRLLLDITKKISRSLNLEEVLAQVMDTLDSLLPYDAAASTSSSTSRRRGRAARRIEIVRHGQVFHAEAVRGYDIEELMELNLKLG